MCCVAAFVHAAGVDVAGVAGDLLPSFHVCCCFCRVIVLVVAFVVARCLHHSLMLATARCLHRFRRHLSFGTELN